MISAWPRMLLEAALLHRRGPDAVGEEASTGDEQTPLRVLGLASSEPEFRNPNTGVGGVVHYLFRAMAARARVVEVYQPEVPWTVRWLSKTVALRHQRSLRELAYPLQERLFLAKSRLCRAKVALLRGEIDVVLQLLFHFAPTDVYPSPAPYCLYADWTTALTNRLYPQWSMVSVGSPFERLQRPLVANAAYLFTFTELVRRSLVDDYGLPPERVIKVGAGINLDRLPPLQPKRYDTHEPILLGVANTFEMKGMDVLLRALPLIRRQVPTCRVVLAGGAARSASRPPPGVELRQHVTKAELEDLYRAATLFVLPTRAEAFGIAYMEAMAFQLPCLGTRTGGVPEVIAEGVTGCLVPVGDHLALAERAVELLADPAGLASMGRRAHARVAQEFTWERVVDRMLPYLARAAAASDDPLSTAPELA